MWYEKRKTLKLTVSCRLKDLSILIKLILGDEKIFECVFIWGIRLKKKEEDERGYFKCYLYPANAKKKCFPVNYMAFLYLVLILPLLRIFSSGYIK